MTIKESFILHQFVDPSVDWSIDQSVDESVVLLVLVVIKYFEDLKNADFF